MSCSRLNPASKVSATTGDLQEVYDTERQLLYVSCTRARDQLSVSGIEPVSEFIEDLTAT